MPIARMFQANPQGDFLFTTASQEDGRAMSKTSRSQAISHGIPLSDARAKRSMPVELFRGRERQCRCLGSFRGFRVRLASAAIFTCPGYASGEASGKSGNASGDADRALQYGQGGVQIRQDRDGLGFGLRRGAQNVGHDEGLHAGGMGGGEADT